MKVSVIVPTYNGVQKVINILRALEKQKYSDFETLIVIDGSTDGTAAAIRNQTFQLKSLRLIEQSNQGRSVVRNRGAKEATGDLLIFFDDDMRPDPDCVAMHVKHHTGKPSSLFAGAQFDNNDKSLTDIQLYKAYLSAKWISPFKGLSEKPLKKEQFIFTSANFSIPKTLFNSLGAFDESMSDAEDFDFSLRAFLKGIPLYYNPEVFAWHDDLITCASYIKRQRQYAIAQKKLTRNKPELFVSFKARTVTPPAGIKAFIYKLFTYKFWINTVDHFNWLRIFPKVIRYRIYNFIITANGIYFPDRVKL